MQKPIITADKPVVPADTKIIDAYTSTREELFHARNPKWKKGVTGHDEELRKFLSSEAVPSAWVWYEDQNTLVHTVPESIYYELLTARNKFAISPEEQSGYRNLRTGIIGLSIGSTVVHAFAMTGGPKQQKIADFDTVEITNLNRMRAGLTDVGRNKTDVAAQNAWSIDPFLELDTWDKGVSADTLEKFILEPKLDIFIDEMDSLDLKVRARLICKANKIPVVMATDNGDSIILDIERFDTEPDRPIFHGMVEGIETADLGSLTYAEWLSVAAKIVGANYLTEAMQTSLLAIGTSIASVPQLGTTASTAAAGITFACRRIGAGRDLQSGRYTLGFESLLIPGYNTDEQIRHRHERTEHFKKSFGAKS